MANKRPHRRNFTAGEVSDILSEKIDFSRYQNGCFEMLNMLAIPQGPAIRRSGFEFIYDLTSLGPDTSVRPRVIPFIFNRAQAYALVFFKHTNTKTRVCFATASGLVESSTPGVPYVFEFSGTMDFTKFDWAQMNDVMKLVQPTATPVDFKRLGHNSWAANNIVFVDPPTGASGWEAPDNWPTRVGFFEQRICFAATKVRPQTLWFSKSGDFEDMGVSSPIVDSDAVTLTMNSGTQNEIQWLHTARQLLAGTLGDEWTIAGKGLDPLSFDSFMLNRYTRQGSEPLKPLMIGPVTLFVELLGKTVNQFGYDYATDSYDVVDLSVLAPHLTEQNSIVDWTYQKTPHGVVYAVRDDGILLGLTMKREHNVVGWHRHITAGKFLAVTAIPGDTETDLFAVVERVIDGETKWYIEKKAPNFVSDSAIDGRFLDSFLSYSGDAISTVTGLDHLEGETVSILANGRPYPDQVVVGGRITLAKSFSNIVVGLPFRSRLIPTPGVVSLEDGTSQGLVRRITGTVISVRRSSGFKIGRINDAGEEILTYIPQMPPDLPDSQPIPLITRNIYVDLPESSLQQDLGRSEKVVIEQSLPLPLTVLGLTDHIYFSEEK